MRSKILALMMLTAIIVLDIAVGHAQNLNSSTARLCNGLPYLCERRFDEVTFPGNHNAGSGAGGFLHDCGGHIASSCLWRNQGKTITEQLEFGIRYFDIDTCACGDICTCEDELITCHGGGGWAMGPSIERMFDEFDAFLKLEENRNEVIVLTFGDQFESGWYSLQWMLYNQLLRWEPTTERLENRDLTIFKKNPEDPWPTLGYLVDTNQRIVVFLRKPGGMPHNQIDPELKLLFEEMGVLSERDHIFDTWRSRECSVSCYGVVPNTYEECFEAPSDKLVLITVNCSSGLCLSELAFLCQRHLLAPLERCRCGLSKLPYNCTPPLSGRIPNFITADWTQNVLKAEYTVWPVSPNIVNVVKYFNQKILKEHDKALVISNDAANHIGFESYRNGKMISAGIEFNTQSLTVNELWKYEKYVHDQPEHLEYLEYGKSICLKSKSNDKYLRARWWDDTRNGLYESNWCRGDEEWRIERYDPENPYPKNTEGFVQAGDPICLYSVQHDRYVRARDYDLKLQVHCETDEKFYIHAGWNDSDEDRVIDEGDNCPDTYNPEQEDTDEDGKGDACDTDPVADANGPYVSECTSPAGADVQLDGSGSFDLDGELVAYDWLVSGQTASGVAPILSLALGIHDVNLEVQDNDGYTDSDHTTVTVQDTIAPTIESVIATPNVLWPPNHKMIPVTMGVSASDSCDSAPFCRIVSVESSEPGGENSPDWQITGNLTVNLRSERDGSGNGRVYTSTVECTDKSGNSLSETAIVTVPHDQGKKEK
jgi:hypothetical protein